MDWVSLSLLCAFSLASADAAAIRDHPLSLTLPYLAFTPVFVIAVAWVLLGEEVSPLGAAGVGLVVAGGVALIAR
jgi:drug/metabolite transporter (DMT)-like permease